MMHMQGCYVERLGISGSVVARMYFLLVDKQVMEYTVLPF